MPTNRQFSMALQALTELKHETSTADSSEKPVPAASALSDVLAGIGSLPPEALFLGVASDNLPVLLNLRDPHPGPMLVVGDAGAGKTAFLQTIAQSVVNTHNAGDVQFGVITNYPDEWERMEAAPHRVGIFAVGTNGTQEFVKSLASWAHSNKNTRQCVLLLVDDLESVVSMDPETVQNFRWLLLRGPARRVWPIVTLNAPRYGQVISWLQSFRTRVFGRVANARVAEALGGDKASTLGELEAQIHDSPGVLREFSLREKDNWLRFWLPSC
ncbi:MAG TPA: FtsK/SpoIIIE domain-containing protein [Anaerolineales bacterium]|nr:FtsK/SpoIIIE domain-containing protein [Anaerolineales bacterium]